MKRIVTMLLVVMGFITGVFAEKINVTCQLGSKVKVLSMGAPVSYACTVIADSGVKSVKLKGLPSGLKYDKKTQKIVGSPTKSGQYTIDITVVTQSKAKGTLRLGVVKVPEYADIVVGNFKGLMRHNEKKGILTMKISNKGKVSGKLVYGDKKSLAIKRGWFTVADNKISATFLLTFKDGSTETLKFTADVMFNGVSCGHFTNYSSSGLVDVVQDVFSLASTKAAAKQIVGKKRVYNEEHSKGYLDYAIANSGSVTATGTYDGKKFTCKTALIPYGDYDGYHYFVCYVISPDAIAHLTIFFAADNNGGWYNGI